MYYPRDIITRAVHSPCYFLLLRLGHNLNKRIFRTKHRNSRGMDPDSIDASLEDGIPLFSTAEFHWVASPRKQKLFCLRLIFRLWKSFLSTIQFNRVSLIAEIKFNYFLGLRTLAW